MCIFKLNGNFCVLGDNAIQITDGFYSRMILEIQRCLNEWISDIITRLEREEPYGRLMQGIITIR